MDHDTWVTEGIIAAMQAMLDEEEDGIRERAKTVLLRGYHAKSCSREQGCSCDMARDEYATWTTGSLADAADDIDRVN